MSETLHNKSGHKLTVTILLLVITLILLDVTTYKEGPKLDKQSSSTWVLQ